jgi:hypothetical protein
MGESQEFFVRDLISWLDPTLSGNLSSSAGGFQSFAAAHNGLRI